jgi:hypothetical protein
MSSESSIFRNSNYQYSCYQCSYNTIRNPTYGEDERKDTTPNMICKVSNSGSETPMPIPEVSERKIQ